MTLRKKTLLISGITLLSLFVAIYSAAKTILLDGFAHVEEQDTQQNVRRVLEAYNDELLKLNLMNADEAEWDGSYTAIKSGDYKYFNSGFNYGSLVRSGLDLIIFIRRSDRKIVYGSFINSKYKKSLPVPKDLQQYFQSNNSLLLAKDPEQQQMGMLLLPEGTLLISARQVLTSEGKGPSSGILIMGR